MQALELGANDYVAKPIEFPVVLARVKTQLARRQAERALKESEGIAWAACSSMPSGIPTSWWS